MPVLTSVTLNYPPVNQSRVQMLDELRGLAIVQILTYHICGVTGFPNYSHGELGVDMFVLLSGAALTLSHRPEEGAIKFMWRRLVRLLPAYWIALTIFWQAGAHLLNRVSTTTDVISHFLCVHIWWGDKYIFGFNDAFWFLGLIVPLYLVYAFLRRFLDRMDIVVGLGLILSFALTYFTARIAQQPALFVHLGLRPPIFFIGLIFGLMLRDGTARIPLTAWLGLGVLLTWYGTFFTGLMVGYNIAGFAVFFAYFALRANAHAAGKHFLCRMMAWLGLISYEIYLLHQPLIREYNHYVWTQILKVQQPVAWQIAVGVFVALAITIPLAWVLQRVTQRLARGILS